MKIIVRTLLCRSWALSRNKSMDAAECFTQRIQNAKTRICQGWIVCLECLVYVILKKPPLKQHCTHLWCRSLSHPHHVHRIQLLWILTFDSDRTCYFTYRYAIMMECWETEPENRPSFDSLCNKIKRLEMGVNQVRNPSVWFRDLFNRSKVIFFLLKLPTETVLWFNYYYYKSSVRKKEKRTHTERKGT